MSQSFASYSVDFCFWVTNSLEKINKSFELANVVDALFMSFFIEGFSEGLLNAKFADVGEFAREGVDVNWDGVGGL